MSQWFIIAQTLHYNFYQVHLYANSREKFENCNFHLPFWPFLLSKIFVLYFHEINSKLPHCGGYSNIFLTKNFVKVTFSLSVMKRGNFFRLILISECSSIWNPNSFIFSSQETCHNHLCRKNFWKQIIDHSWSHIRPRLNLKKQLQVAKFTWRIWFYDNVHAQWIIDGQWWKLQLFYWW